VKRERSAALLSLLIHGVFIGIVAVIAAFSVPALRTLTIDFSIEKSQVIPSPSRATLPESHPHKTRRPPPPPIKEEMSFPDTTAEDCADDSVEFTDEKSGEAGDQAASIDPAGTPQDTGLIRENQRQRYLKERFEYIRDIIYRKAIYPSTAIEMNITGTVFLSFCVREDGDVENVDIIKGSGASVLDRDAVSTIRRAAPFPRPPVRVVVKFPLKYQLE
jgi:protein TonB